MKQDKYILIYDYLDETETIPKGTIFEIKKVWHNCIQTEKFLISIDAFNICAKIITDIN